MRRPGVDKGEPSAVSRDCDCCWGAPKLGGMTGVSDTFLGMGACAGDAAISFDVADIAEDMVASVGHGLRLGICLVVACVDAALRELDADAGERGARAREDADGDTGIPGIGGGRTGVIVLQRDPVAARGPDACVPGRGECSRFTDRI